MRKLKHAAPANRGEDDSLAEAVDRLAGELSSLRDVIDRLREDVSWVTRNGLPVQLVDASAALSPRPSTPELSGGGDSGAEIVESLVGAVEAIAQGQLEVVLTALNGIQRQLLAVIEKQALPQKRMRVATAQVPEAQPPSSEAAAPPGDAARDGRLF
jgi:hypothetical protein